MDGGAWQAADNVRSLDAAVTGDGQHDVKARATDAAGNTSDEASLVVKIDATRPTVTGTLDVAARAVSATAADAGSGPAGIEYAIDAPTGGPGRMRRGLSATATGRWVRVAGSPVRGGRA